MAETKKKSSPTSGSKNKKKPTSNNTKKKAASATSGSKTATKATSKKKPVAKDTNKKAAPKAKPEPKTKGKAAAKKSNTTARKKAKKTFWKVAVVVLLVIAILLIGAIVTNMTNDKPRGETKLDETKEAPVYEGNDFIQAEGVTLVVIEDPDCAVCGVDTVVDQLKQNLIPDLEVKKIDYRDPSGLATLTQLDMGFVPLYLFSEQISERSDWGTLSNAFIEVDALGGTFYMLNPQAIPGKVLIKEPEVTDTAIVIGEADAPVTVYEFSDYACPFCAIAEGNEDLVEAFKSQSGNTEYVAPVPKIFEEYVDTGKVRFVFYNFPVDAVHPKARNAHNAALCAHEVGYWKGFNDILFDRRDEWLADEDPRRIFRDYAITVGITEDLETFLECYDTKKYDSQVDEEIILGLSYGVSGTPAFYINKVLVSGAQDYNTFKAIIDDELSR